MITINGGSHRYLGELDEFKGGLPHGVVNKTKTDVGGTFVAATCRSNYIIVCPFVDLVKSIAEDKNLRDIEVFPCFGGVKQTAYESYLKRRAGKPLKVAVTYDSLPKLLRWMDYQTEVWKLLIDEYHLILEDCDFRTEAIEGLMRYVKQFEHFTFLSATQIDEDYEIAFLRELPHYRVTWDNVMPIQVHRIHATKLNKGLAQLIKVFMKEGLACNNIRGENTRVEELYVFVNSVTTIKQICDTLEIAPEEVKICCADRKRNKLLIGNYAIEPVTNPNKRINFFTKKCFQGCNLFTNNGLIIVASDGGRTNTLVDISTTME